MATPTQDQYSPATQQIETQGHPTHPGSSFLPLTGLDVGILGVAAVAMILAGILLRKVSA